MIHILQATLYNMRQLADQGSHETFKTALPRYMETKNPTFKGKPLEFLKEKEVNMKNRITEATTSSNLSAATASFLVANLVLKLTSQQAHYYW